MKPRGIPGSRRTVLLLCGLTLGWMMPALPIAVTLSRAAEAPAIPAWQRAVGSGTIVSRRVPVLGPNAAGEMNGARLLSAPVGSPSTAWALCANAAGRVFQDISFADSRTGFVAGELGVVYRTTDGGAHWQQAMNLGYPYYWYGVEALNLDSVVVAGFQIQSGEGIVRWSEDGGVTWGPILAVHPDAWLDKIRFADSERGIATTMAGGQIVRTTGGGRTAPDWSRVIADSTGGWFAGNFTFEKDLPVMAAGAHLCRSSDGGASWSAQTGADPVFDGAVEFVNPSLGFTGGGNIAPGVQGWVHRTTDGGNTWTDRLLVTPYPVRAVRFATPMRGWAAGGDIDSNAGGIWGTTDGGNTWTREIDTAAEMRSLSLVRVGSDSVDVWGCGYTAAFQGRIYHCRVYLPAPAAVRERTDQSAVSPVRTFPNPFSPSTSLSFFMARPESVLVEIFDPAGRVIRRIEPGLVGSGTHEILWDGRDEAGRRLASGVFFYRFRAGDEVKGGTLVLVR